MRKTFIYILVCPESGEVRYVGKTINLKKRYSCHFSLAVAKKKYRSYVGNWIASLRKRGLRPIMEVIEECYADWSQREKYWISSYRNSGASLCNLTDGGEGMCGMVVSAKTRTKISMNNGRATIRTVYKFDLKGSLICEYKSATEAAIENGLPLCSVTKCCRGEQKRGGKFHWSYDGEFKPMSRNHNAKSVLQFSKDGVLLKEHSSLWLAEKEIGGSRNNIRSVALGRQKTAYGYIWKYKTAI